MTTILPPRRFLCLLALLALAACGDDTHHDSMAGTPSHWWSENYYSMLADANSLDASGKPKANKLP